MTEATRLHETGILDEFVTCPYVTSHVMLARRFPAHLIKCRQQNPEKAADFVICDYNHNHHVHKDDMEMHLSICPQYHYAQRFVVNAAKKKQQLKADLESGKLLPDNEMKPEEKVPPPPTQEEMEYVKEWI